ncbi:MAG: MBL fold metallo-hydrolase [Candidatus Tectomicrobia bacterium]|nr:MBL fold metallo-hydrolase [Candidatus Tectomicrobia bacterium]
MRRLIILLLSILIAASLLPSPIGAQNSCKQLNLVKRGGKLERDWNFLRRVGKGVETGRVTITWFGHSYFRFTSSGGTQVITDPFGFMGYPIPTVSPHIATIGREHPNHNSISLVKGNPLVLRGLARDGTEWNPINVAIMDAMIYSIPIYHRGWLDQIKGAAFAIHLNGLCIVHLGDLGDELNESQIAMIGEVDILLIPIGGLYTMDPETAKKVLRQLNPKIAIPMHYRNDEGLLQRFLRSEARVKRLQYDTVVVEKSLLPVTTEIVVLQHKSRRVID